MQYKNYVNNLPDDGLIRSTHVEEITMINGNVGHHQYTKTTRSCTSKTVLTK
jgi:hypothetical protein